MATLAEHSFGGKLHFLTEWLLPFLNRQQWQTNKAARTDVAGRFFHYEYLSAEMDLAFDDTAPDDSEKNAHTRVGEELQNLLMRLEEEFRLLSASRDEISKRIAAVKRTVNGLNALFGAEEHGPSHRRRRAAGLTKLCRQLLSNSNAPMTLPELIDGIMKRHPEALAHHEHPQNSMMMILKRLLGYGEIIEVKNERGLRTWAAAREPNASAAPSDEGSRQSTSDSLSRSEV